MITITDRDKAKIVRAVENGDCIVIAIDSNGVYLGNNLCIVSRLELGEIHYHTTRIIALPVDAKFRERIAKVLTTAPQLPAYYLDGGGGWFVIRAQNKAKAYSTGVEEFGRGGVRVCRRATETEIERYRSQRGSYEESINGVIYRRKTKCK